MGCRFGIKLRTTIIESIYSDRELTAKGLSILQQHEVTMGLKCSVIGHKYGETEVEREREEQGSEVVITIQERETCTRCGTTRIVSENKEVTAIETPSDIADDVANTAPDDSEPESTVDTATPDSTVEATAVEPSDDDAELIDEVDKADDTVTEQSSMTAPEPEHDGPETDPETDDGVILDSETSGSDDREPGEWPQEADDETDDWEPAMGDDDSSPDVEPAGGTAVTVPTGQYHCPECNFTTDVESTSLRAGDFCPECHKGALITTDE